MIDWKTWYYLLWEIVLEFRHSLEREVEKFTFALENRIDVLVSRPLHLDWRKQMAHFLLQWEGEGYRLTPRSLVILEWWIVAVSKKRGFWPPRQPPPVASYTVGPTDNDLPDVVSGFEYTKAVRWNTPPLGKTPSVTRYEEARYLGFAYANTHLALGPEGSKSLSFKKTWEKGVHLKPEVDGKVLAFILNEAQSNSVDSSVAMKWNLRSIEYTFKARWEWQDEIDWNSFVEGWSNIDPSTWTSLVGSSAGWLAEGFADLFLDKEFDFDYPFVGVWHEEVTIVLPR